MPFKPFVWAVNLIEPALSLPSLSCQEMAAFPSAASSSGTRRARLLRVKKIIANTKQLIKRERRLIDLKRATRASDDAADVNRGFGDTLAPFILTGVGQSFVEEWTHLVGKNA